jgi:hypothetical protein
VFDRFWTHPYQLEEFPAKPGWGSHCHLKRGTRREINRIGCMFNGFPNAIKETVATSLGGTDANFG